MGYDSGMPQDDAHPGPSLSEDANARTVRELEERLRRVADTLRGDEGMAVEFRPAGGSE